LITCPPALATAAYYLDRLPRHGVEVVLADVVQQVPEEELIGMMGDIDGMVAGDDPLTARVLEHAPRLRVIVRWGIGMDNVDLAAAERLGIRVVNTPGVFGDEVADVAIGYLIMLARRLHRTDRGVRDGQWPKPQGWSLAGRRLAIVGLGSIGRAVARRAQAMGMIVAGHDVVAGARDAAAAQGIEIAEFERMLGDCDALVLCSNLTPENRGLINRRTLALMRPDSFLINVSRGGLIDEDALIEALSGGRLGGAARDVYEREPLPIDSALRGFDTVILGSHNASNTIDAVRRVNELAVDLLLRGLAEVSR
jgi:D-3-phosphoglycerate dehydrogenase